MSIVLALTVGGSSNPLVRSINEYQPEKVLFFVTDESRQQVLENVDGNGSIISRTHLAESAYTLVTITNPDNLSGCAEEMREAMLAAAKKAPQGRLIADYTGGTKTMSAALVTVALRLHWEISLVQGKRTNAIRTLNGTEIAQLIPTASLYLAQELESARPMFDFYQYDAVENLLSSVLREAPVSSDKVKLAIVMARAFAAWDKFNHSQALDILRTEKKRFPTYVKCLAQLTGEGQVTHYEKVWDLLRNAERRAKQGHYDDSVLRLYRALEMFAQIRLRTEHAVNTDDIDLGQLPADARKAFDQQVDQGRKKITAGLYLSYNLLRNLSDPIGPIYESWEKKINDLLDQRNRSILAHGEQPVGQDMWQRAHLLAREFLGEAAAAIGVSTDWPQFPRWEEVMEQS